MSIAHLDATAQAALVRRGELTPRELVEAAQARIGRHDAELGAVVRHTDDVAAATLRALPDGPFRGVPIVIKDLIADVAGTPQGAGCRILRRLAPPAPADSHLVAQLRRAGFVIVGKTNTSEFGILPTAEPLGLPSSRNPYDTTRSTGGSSGGSAAAVASGMVPIGHANDGGGSIRIPASCCGLFGLKPSRGRVSLAPRYGDLNGGLAAEHVVTRSVRDSAAVLDVLAGPVSGDPYAAPAPRRPYREEVGAPVGRLRIGFATHFPAGDGTMRDSEPECVAAVAHAARLLTALGHDVEHHDIAALRDPEWTPRFLAIWAVGVAAHLAEIERHTGAPLGDEDVEPLTLAIGTIGKGMAGHVYVSAWQWLHRKAREVATTFDTYDLWLTPTVTTPPPPLGTFTSPPDDVLAGIFRAAEYAPFTALFNATGQPAMSVPLYRSRTGLPIGVQLAAAYGREDVLFRVAAQLEAAQPFVHGATRT